jgi:uncharacterized protein
MRSAALRLLATLAAATVIVPSVAWAAAQPSGPSFTCPGTSETEAAICADPDLAADDRRMQSLYSAAKPGALGNGSSQLAAQRKWLKERDKCNGDGWKSYAILGVKDVRECVALSYSFRLEDLAIADLFVSHTAAMAELTRQTPKDAPIYEAIYQYATISDPTVRAKAVKPLVSPVFEATRVHPAQDVPGVGHVPESPEIRFNNIPTAEAAVASDKNFSAFLDVAFEWAMDRDREGLLPCGALVRRPGLIAAMGERWDPYTDCDDTLPSTPAFDRLVDLAGRASPPCQGTIVIDIGATWQASVTSRRLNLPDQASRFFNHAGKMDLTEQRFRRKAKIQIEAANMEMAHYYAAYFNLTPSVADQKAIEMVNEGVSAAFECQYD